LSKDSLLFYTVSMKDKRILVTARTNPDLDGLASAWAYSEFLTKIGQKAVLGIFGNVDLESGFVLHKLKIDKVPQAEKIVDSCQEVIINDISDVRLVSSKIDPNQVIEIIDHRRVHRADGFPRAKVQIELVGAAATLITEKYFQEGIEISPESALFLYSAIVSNTINFKAKVTTERDRKMASWLEDKIQIPTDYVKQMFTARSKLSEPLEEVLVGDHKIIPEYNGYKVSVFQLEIIEAEKFIEKNLEELKNILLKHKNQESLDFMFLTCIDIEKGFNMFLVVDDDSQKLVAEVLKVKFTDGVAKLDEVIMRKEIVPRIKEYLENSNVSV